MQLGLGDRFSQVALDDHLADHPLFVGGHPATHLRVVGETLARADAAQQLQVDQAVQQRRENRLGIGFLGFREGLGAFPDLAPAHRLLVDQGDHGVLAHELAHHRAHRLVSLAAVAGAEAAGALTAAQSGGFQGHRLGRERAGGSARRNRRTGIGQNLDRQGRADPPCTRPPRTRSRGNR